MHLYVGNLTNAVCCKLYGSVGRSAVPIGIELARAYVRVRGDASGLQQDLDGVRGQVDSSMKSIAAGAVAILAPFAKFGEGILRQGLQAAAVFEQTTVEMETMIGSAKETAELLGKLTEFAVLTPFEMPQLLQVTRGLVQFGERGDELMETIRVLGDASGGTAEKFQILGMVFNQIRGVGRLLTQDFRQLSNRGIISLQDIAKHYKVTTGEAQKMLSSSKISFEDFRKIMKGMTEEGGRFHNMMEKQSQTLKGLTSTLNDALSIAKRTLVTPLVPLAKSATNAMILLANAVEGFVRRGGEAVSLAFAGATSFASLGTSIFGAALVAKLLGLTFRRTFLGTGIGLAVISLGAGIGILVGKLRESKAVTDALGMAWVRLKIFAQMYIDAIRALIVANKAIFADIQRLFNSVIQNLVGVFIGFGDAAGKGFLGMLPSVNAVVVALQWVIDKLKDIMNWLDLMTVDWNLTWELMKINAVMAWTFVENEALKALNNIKAAIEAFRVVWQVEGENIKRIFTTVLDLIEGHVRAVWKGIEFGFGILVDNIGVMLKDLALTFEKFFGKIVAAIMGKGDLGKVIDDMQAHLKIQIESRKLKNPFAEGMKDMLAHMELSRDIFKGEMAGKPIFPGGGRGKITPVGEVVDNIKKVFDVFFKLNKGGEDPLKKQMDRLEEEARNTKEKMEVARFERDVLRQEEALSKRMPFFEADKGRRKEGRKREIGEDVGITLGLPSGFTTGRYSFLEVGNKIQDAMLKDKEDVGKKTVSLLEAGNELQEQTLKATKENKPVGFLK